MRRAVAVRQHGFMRCFPGFDSVEVSAEGGTGNEEGEYAVIDFGENPDRTPHTVTVTVIKAAGSSSYAAFDRMLEYYSGWDDAPDAAEDPKAPHIYYSRSFPPTGSVGYEDDLSVYAYILDDSSLQAITLNSEPVPADACRRVGAQYWEIDLGAVIKANGQ